MSTPKEHAEQLIVTAWAGLAEYDDDKQPETLPTAVRNVLLTLVGQLDHNARQAEQLNRKGWKTRKTATELINVTISDIAKAVEQLSTISAAEPCKAVQVETGAPCTRVGPHEAHAFDSAPAVDTSPLARPFRTTPPAPPTCGQIDPYGGGTPDACLLDPDHVNRTPRENHQGRYSRWPVRDMQNDDPQAAMEAEGRRYVQARMPAIAEQLSETLGVPLQYVTGAPAEPVPTEVRDLSLNVEPSLFPASGPVVVEDQPKGYVETGLSDQIVIPGNIQGHPFTDSKPLSAVLEAGVQPEEDPFSDPVSNRNRWSPEPRPAPWVSNSPAPATVHVTGVTTGESCGLQLRLTGRDNVPEWPAWWNVGGTAFHACAEHLERMYLNPNYDMSSGLDPNDAATWFQHHMNEAAEQQVLESGKDDQFRDPATWRVAQKGVEDEAWWREAGPIMVQRYAAWSAQMHADGWSILQLPSDEHPREVMIPALELKLALGDLEGTTDQVWCRWIPSAVVKFEVMIVDPKSGYEMPSSNWQLGAYAHMLVAKLRTLGWEVGREYALGAAYYNARDGELGSIIDPLAMVSPEEYEYRVQTVMGMHHSNLYPANPSTEFGGPCGVCAVRYACPIMARRGS